ncbi:MAG: peptidase, partial [Hyphomicrobiales bacterium]|nr:peptidase [Hyphomicrobiales bacterium]
MSLSPVRAAALAFVLALSGAPALVSAQEQPAPAPTAPADKTPVAPADQKPAIPPVVKPPAVTPAAPATPPATTPSKPATPANPAPPSPDAPAPAAAPADTTPAKHPRKASEIYSDLDLFGEVFDRIRAEYVDAPDEKELIHAALNGMLTSLDPHSGYLAPQAYSDMQQDTSGQFGGLGIEVTMENGVLKVVSPIDDTPAARAGILPNDFIVELDGVQVQGQSL